MSFIKRSKLIVPVLTGTLIFSCYGYSKYKTLETENNQLKQKLDNNKDDNNISYKTSVDEIKEINNKNINLILYESNFTNYNASLDDYTFFGIDADVNTKFKFNVVIDLSKAEINNHKDKIIVNINKEDIKLNTIEIDRVKIDYHLNIINQFRGNRIVELESEIMTKTYDEIERIVTKEYKLNKELYQLRLMEKLDKLYPQDVEVIIN